MTTNEALELLKNSDCISSLDIISGVSLQGIYGRILYSKFNLRITSFDFSPKSYLDITAQVTECGRIYEGLFSPIEVVDYFQKNYEQDIAEKVAELFFVELGFFEDSLILKREIPIKKIEADFYEWQVENQKEFS